MTNIIKTTNNYFLEKYPHFYIETEEISVFPPNYAEERDYATEVRYLNKKYTNIGINPVIKTGISKKHSSSLYFVVNEEINKFKSVIDFGEKFEEVLSKLENFLSRIFAPKEKDKGYFGSFSFSPGLYIDGYFTWLNSVQSEEKALEFFEKILSGYEVQSLGDIRTMEIINYLRIKSNSLVPLRKNNKNIYYAKISFSVHFFLKEIL
ncbi:MAG: hypothetical protein QXX30_00270 [Candidatus Aenigmatarchaeota archaeon]